MQDCKKVMSTLMKTELEDLSTALLEQRELLQALRSGSALRAARLTGMPKAPHGSGRFRFESDRIAAIITTENKIHRLEDDIRERIAVIRDHSDEVRNAAQKVRLLNLRYLHGREWGDVLAALYGSQGDFLQRRESYRRSMFRMLDAACAEVWLYWR